MSLDPYVRIAKYAGLRQDGPLLAALSTLDGDAGAVADTLHHHHLIRFVRSLVPEDVLRARLPAELVDALASRRPIGRVPVRDQLRVFDEIQRALAAADVPVLVLKGFYFADRLYGGLEGRPQYDIDVLVRRRDFRAAARNLEQLGFARKGRDLHSVDFVRGDIKIDVHRFLRWAPAFALDERTVWETAEEVRIEGLTTQTLSDEYSLVFLAMASFEDIGQGMGRLKQLLDLYLFLRSVDATMDWDAFFLRRARENLLTITVNVFALVTDLFEARDEFANLTATLDRRRDPRVLGSRTAALALVSAPRKCHANLLWFGRIYPGSLPHYLAWFWYAGFPANLWRLGPAWALSHLRLATELSRARRDDASRSRGG